MTPLRQRMIEKLELRNYSPKTISAYVAAVAQFAKYFGRSPDRLTGEEIRLWQVHLRDSRRVSWSAFNIAMCALRFFYREVAGRDDLIPRLAFMRKERPLPVVPSADEVCCFFEAVPVLRYRMVLTVAYGCGLRLSEAVRLEPRDIDTPGWSSTCGAAKGGRTATSPSRRCFSTCCAAIGRASIPSNGFSRACSTPLVPSACPPSRSAASEPLQPPGLVNA